MRSTLLMAALHYRHQRALKGTVARDVIFAHMNPVRIRIKDIKNFFISRLIAEIWPELCHMRTRRIRHGMLSIFDKCAQFTSVLLAE